MDSYAAVQLRAAGRQKAGLQTRGVVGWGEQDVAAEWYRTRGQRGGGVQASDRPPWGRQKQSSVDLKMVRSTYPPCGFGSVTTSDTVTTVWPIGCSWDHFLPLLPRPLGGPLSAVTGPSS